MARVNVYLPDDLAAEAKQAGLNVSAITQDALRRSLAAERINRWLEEMAKKPRLFPTITHDEVIEAVHAARDEMGA